MQLSTALLNGLRPGLTWACAWLESTRVFRTLSATASIVADACRLPVPVPIPVPTRRPQTFLALGLGAFVLIGSAMPALAAPRRSAFELQADGRLVDVQVMVEGRTAPLFFAPGRNDRHYFQAFEGRNYALVLQNNSARRVGVLIAVDGLNVVNGERSRLSRNEPMYVLGPHERTVIKGWRTSLRDVRKFVFVDEQRSYSERTGQANGDMGWIRVLAFREQQWMPWLREGEGKIRDRNDGWDEDRPYGAKPEAQEAPPLAQGGEGVSPQGSAQRMQGEQYRGESKDSNPGTGWGDRSWDPVNRTQFTPERNAVDHLVLRYEYASGLRALGIEPRWFRDGRTWERERGELGFAQPPRW
jgi:hypothetical protein